MNTTQDTYSTVTLSRTGAPPIRFTGTLIGKADNRGPNSNRWVIWRIYETRSGKLVLHTENRTQWEGETSTSDVDVYRDSKSMSDDIRSRGLVPNDLSNLLVDMFPEHWVETID